MKKSYLILVALMAIVLTGCPQVQMDYDRDADFSSFKTFEWKVFAEEEMPDFEKHRPILAERIRKAIEEELATKGLVKAAEGENADLRMGYFFNVEVKRGQDTVYYSNTYTRHVAAGPWGWDPYGPGLVHSETRNYEYKEGTFIFKMVDEKQDRVIWQGWLVEQFSGKGNPSDEKLKSRVKMLFEKYPPGTVK